MPILPKCSFAPAKMAITMAAVLSYFSSATVMAASEISINGSAFQPIASPITIVQENISNSVGIIENSIKSDSAIKQTGHNNRAAIIQFGNDKAILLRQPGLLNRALIVQVASTAQDHQTIDARQGESADAVNYIYSLQTSVNSNNPIEADFGRLTVEGAKLVAQNFILAPEVSRVNVGMLEDISLHFNAALENQIDQHRFQPFSDDAANTANTANTAQPFFATLGYGQANKSSVLGVSGYDHRIRSVTVGRNFRLNAQSKFGLAAQYTESNSTLQEGLGSVRAKGYQIGALGSFSESGYYLDLIGNIGKVNFSSDRFGGASRVYSDNSGWHYTGRAQGGYLFENGSLRFGPLVSASYVKGTANGYQENGSTLLTQAIEKQTIEKISASLGGVLYFNDTSTKLTTSTTSTTSTKFPVSSYLKAEIVRDVGRGNNDFLQSRFSFSSQTVITPLNDNTSETYGRVSAGINVSLRKDIQFILSGTTTTHTDRLKRHNAYLGLSVAF